jgi:hypothetical protein
VFSGERLSHTRPLGTIHPRYDGTVHDRRPDDPLRVVGVTDEQIGDEQQAKHVEFGLITGERGADDPVMVRVAPVDGGLQVLVSQEAGNALPLHAETVDPEKFGDRTWVGTVGNKVKGDVEGADPDTVKRTFERVCGELAANFESYEEELRAPVVDEYLAATDAVEKFKGETAEVTVHFAPRDGNGPLAVTVGEGEWLNGEAAGKVRTRFWGEYDEDLELDDEAWSQLREQWEDDMEVTGRERTTEADAATTSVVDALRRQVTPKADAEALARSEYVGWYETNSNQSDVSGDVVWVRTGALSTALDDTSKGSGWINSLSRELQEKGYTKAGSIERRGHRVYPFKPEALDVDRDAVLGDDDGDDDDDGPEVAV